MRTVLTIDLSCLMVSVSRGSDSVPSIFAGLAAV